MNKRMTRYSGINNSTSINNSNRKGMVGRQQQKNRSNQKSSLLQSIPLTGKLVGPILLFVLLLPFLVFVIDIRSISLPFMSNTSTNYTTDDTTATTASYNSFQYVLIEEGDVPTKHQKEGSSNRRSYQKYRIVDLKDDSVVRYITVQEWVSYILSDERVDDNDNSTKEKPKSPTKYRNNMIDDLNTIIANVPYDAVFFETPAITYPNYIRQNELDPPVQIFEFVLLDAPELVDFTKRKYPKNDYHIFQDSIIQSNTNTDHENNNAYVSSFPNVGGDAFLIVPKYIPSVTNNDIRYTHLSNFIRYTSKTNHDEQQQLIAFWKRVAQTYHNEIDKNPYDKSRPVWLSTSGLGVLYLHVRIDTVPKYYSYLPYKTVSS